MEAPNMPRAIDALYAIGHSLIDTARWEDAAKVFRVMLRLQPEDERPWLGLGHCHEQLGEDEIASEVYGAGAAVLMHRSPRCFLALSRTRRRLDDHDLADESLDICAAIVGEGGHDDVEALLRQEMAS